MDGSSTPSTVSVGDRVAELLRTARDGNRAPRAVQDDNDQGKGIGRSISSMLPRVDR